MHRTLLPDSCRYPNTLRALAVVCALLLQPVAVAAQNDPFLARIATRAQELARSPHKPPAVQLPPALAEIGYDDYRDIRFRPTESLWRGQGRFEVQFFHLGYLYREPVKIYVVEGEEVRPVTFQKHMFHYGKTGLDQKPLEGITDFAGFRIHYPLNRPDYKDELAVFLGASYFRVLGRNQLYGVSARGLAIDTALPKGEEFPAFREFWLVRPGPNATSMTIYALLDSQSLTGAYRFRLTPGSDTVVDVEAVLFARADVQRLGIAPLTTMFFYGENQAQGHDDYRPEVHDSDGLLMHTRAGEWIWRPLTNPKDLHVSALLDERPRGFGIMQRDRNFESYLDLESRFERRPSYWVETTGDSWGKGAVHLVEIPSAEEIHDNIVAFWVPDQPLKAGENRTLSYRLHATLAPALTDSLGHVERTRIGWAAVPGSTQKPKRNVRRFIVDFAGGDLATFSDEQPVKAEVAAREGRVDDVTVQRLPGTKGWRAAFRLTPDGTKPVDLRLFLTLDGRRVTETWNYVWSPNEIH